MDGRGGALAGSRRGAITLHQVHLVGCGEVDGGQSDWRLRARYPLLAEEEGDQDNNK